MKRAPNVFRRSRYDERSCVKEDMGKYAASAGNGATNYLYIPQPHIFHNGPDPCGLGSIM